MGKVTGFLEIDRMNQKYQPASDRIRHFHEFAIPLPPVEVERQAARCMDCGIPYCHGPTGCPVNNQIPDWNDLVYSKNWEDAARNLHSTNNFPEFTGRICPAPCEEACTLYLEDAPVAIKTIEQAIADRAWTEGWIVPEPPKNKKNKSVGIIGAGPAGMAAAQQLVRIGYDIYLYDREPKIGGLLRYGIPDFKMEKHYIDWRAQQLETEGVIFKYGVNVGVDIQLDELQSEHDAILIATGAERPRNPEIPGMDCEGCDYAMPFLVQQNRRTGGEDISDEKPIWTGGKHVVVIGGGDTASDCIGTSFRQGAVAVTQLDIRPLPPKEEDKLTIWPYWPTKFRTSSSQAEGAGREFSAVTLEIIEENGTAIGVKCARGDEQRKPIEGTEFLIRADYVFLAIGFAGPRLDTFLSQTKDKIELDSRTNIKANTEDYKTTLDGVFAAGDVRKGQSLVVWAIREGRQAARSIDIYLSGQSDLPR